MKRVLFFLLFFSVHLYSQNNFVATDTIPDRLSNNEPSIAINPTNYNNFIIGTNYRRWRNVSDPWTYKIGAYYTTNSGITWNSNYLDYSDYRKFADPSVSFNSSGTAYLGFVGAGEDQYRPSNSGIFVCRSTNGGSSWTRISVTEKIWTIDSIEYDKPFITVDNFSGSPYQDQLYISFTKMKILSQNSKRINEIQSSYLNLDFGVFSTPITVNDVLDTIYVTGSYPLTDKNGNVYIIFNKKLGENHSIKIVKSTNGGRDFNAFLSGGLKEKLVTNTVFPEGITS